MSINSLPLHHQEMGVYFYFPGIWPYDRLWPKACCVTFEAKPQEISSSHLHLFGHFFSKHRHHIVRKPEEQYGKALMRRTETPASSHNSAPKQQQHDGSAMWMRLFLNTPAVVNLHSQCFAKYSQAIPASPEQGHKQICSCSCNIVSFGVVM